MGILRRWQRAGWPLLAWLTATLLGCGGTLQAEDTATLTTLREVRQLIDQKQYAPAASKAAAVVQKSPQNPQARYLHALANLGLQEYAVARDELTKAKEIDPLLLFAKSKTEFDGAWKTARNNTMTVLDSALDPPVASPDQPPAKAARQPAAKPAPVKPAKPVKPSGDPLVTGLRRGETLVVAKGIKLPTAADQRSLRALGKRVQGKRLQIRVALLPAAAPVASEAKRLFEAAELADDVLLLAGRPDGQVAVYNPTLTPQQAAQQVKQALARPAKEQSLAARLTRAALAVADALPAPPQPPATESTAPPTPLPAPPPTSPPAPRPFPLGPVVGGLAAVLLGLVAWWAVVKAGARRRLGRSFAAASPRAGELADRLATVLQQLHQQTSRPASAALQRAEEAYAEATAMMAAAAADRTADIARVERANRLYDETAAALTQAENALRGAAGPAPSQVFHCCFSGRPILSRHDGDLVAIRHGEEQVSVLVARRVGDRIRRGEQPLVRAGEVHGMWRHWSQVPGFEPTRDIYRADLVATQWVPASELAEPFGDRSRTVVELSDRPDYTLTW
ncbi:MAG: hypothetical protein IT204_10330 [Fimbriimonadaceae bacterium]|nr:hypothetical protein [Fimbriimonadaceae bacterium]